MCWVRCSPIRFHLTPYCDCAGLAWPYRAGSEGLFDPKVKLTMLREVARSLSCTLAIGSRCKEPCVDIAQ